MCRQDTRRDGGLSQRIAVIVLFALVTADALAADNKACSHPPQPNETLSEKLDQTGGVICPPANIDPAIKAPTPNAGKTP